MTDHVGSAPGSSGSATDSLLEQRYRRWMAAYPDAYRAVREEELVGVLLARSAPGQRRPRPAEVIDLVRAGTTARLHGFRGSARHRAWDGAGGVVGVLLAIALCTPGTVFLTYRLSDIWATGVWAEALGWDPSLLHGWYVPALWLVVVALLLAGRTRPAAAVAWVAVAARIVASATVATPTLAWSTRTAASQLVLGIVAATLLSRPATVRTGLGLLGRRPLAIGTTLFLVSFMAGRWWFRFETTFFVVVVGFAIGAVVVRLVRRSGEGGWRHDPVVRRVVLTVTALIPALILLGSSNRRVSGAQVATGRLAVDVLLQLALVAVMLMLLVSAPTFARRIPFRVVRRTARVDDRT